MINVTTPSALQFFPTIEMTVDFDEAGDTYHEQRRKAFDWSSISIERKASHKFFRDYLQPYLQKN